MKIGSDQVRAARALLDMDQAELARRAGVSTVTVRRVEAGAPGVAAATIGAVAGALEQAGAEFLDGGVRRRAADVAPAHVVEERHRAIREIVARSAPALAIHPPLSDRELYDEGGLPA